jgi:hypothetical protein
MLRHVNKDHVVPELQLPECLYRLMVTALAKAMDGERRLASRSGVGDGLRGWFKGHLEPVSSVFLEQRVYVCDPLLDVVHGRFSHSVGNIELGLGLIRV